MFGILLGLFCVFGLIQLRRFSRHRRRSWRNGREGAGLNPAARRWMLRRLFSRLRTTPEQETALAAAVDDVVDKAMGVRQEMWNAPQVITEVLKKDSFDGDALGGLYKAQAERLELARLAVHNFIATLFSTLTPEQRQRAAILIERRLAWHAGGCDHGHPYRHYRNA